MTHPPKSNGAGLAPTAVKVPDAGKSKLVTRSSDDRSALTLNVSADVVATLRAHPNEFRSLVERYSALLDKSRRTNRTQHLAVEIGPGGKTDFDSLPGTNTTVDASLLDQALEAARVRGRLAAAEILSQPEMLSAEALAERLGVSRVTINDRRRDRQLLALDGAKRGFRFPAWQISEQGKAFPELPTLIGLLEGAWPVYRFLTQRHAALDGETGKDALIGGRGGLVLDAARAYAEGSAA